MKKCLFADQIDDYLLNRLEGEAQEQFEEHYFNCPSCFRQMEERDALVSTIKSRGAWIFIQGKGMGAGVEAGPVLFYPPAMGDRGSRGRRAAVRRIRRSASVQGFFSPVRLD
jgi:anti-sigma factor RsiW